MHLTLCISGCPQKEDIGYENSKELLEQRVPLVFEDRFEKEVNYNFSGVHIPVEIFDGSKFSSQLS